VETTKFGTLSNGTAVDMFTLKNAHGATAKVITYGATLTQLWVPDRSGNMGDVVLGFDNLDGYVGKHPWFGATVGRVTNRIAKGKFTVDGKEYSLEVNDPPNTLHSGNVGLTHVVWKGEALHEPHAAAARFSYVAADGEGGYPGKFSVEVTYRLTDKNELRIEYSATCDKTTPVNMTNHSYFNLDGGPDILAHVLFIKASRYTPVDPTMIPTGEVLPVKGTALDFTHPTAVGDRIHADMLKPTLGYDHHYVADGDMGKMRMIARLTGSASGRQMEVWTTEPGVQLYTGNHLDGTITGKRGNAYKQFGALCLETQHAPDSINHPKFPSTLLHPGERFHSETVYKFSAH
jgi:aldose 1-epimerase